MNYFTIATVLCLDVPIGIEFGIDYQAWVTAKEFKGIKLVPPGVHFIYHCVPNKYGGEGSPRKGIFVKLGLNEVIVRKWSIELEDFIEENQLDPDEVERYKLGVKNYDFDRYLGLYPFESFKKWKSMSSHISESLILKLSPKSRIITSTTKPTKQTLDINYNIDENREDEFYKKFSVGIPVDISNQDYSDTFNFIKYTEIPEKFIPLSSDPKELTLYNFDKSYILESLVLAEYNGNYDEYLGEMEFAFISFLLGQSYESFEQWKKMLVLICGCDKASKDKEEFFLEFLKIIYEQIKEVPNEYFEDIVTSENFIVLALRELMEIVTDDYPETIKNAVKKLQDVLKLPNPDSFYV